MTKLEWGTRYTCISCGCKFYDLKRPEPLCPRCGIDQREAAKEARTPRQSRARGGSAEGETGAGLVEGPIETGLDQEEVAEEEEEEEL